MSTRRDFLKAAGLVVMAGSGGFLGTDQFIYGQDESAGQVSAASTGRDKPTIVTIFLRGGADALNAIVPYGDDGYYAARPRIALHIDAVAGAKGKGGRANEPGVVPIGDNKYWGLNASMAPLLPLMEANQAAAIINVGNFNGTRSHFSAQDYMERGVPGDIGINSGWLNRYLELSKTPFDRPLRGLSAQTLVPRALRGSYPVLAGNNRTEQMDLFENLYSSKNLVNMNARTDSNDQKGSRLDELNSKGGKSALTSDMTRDIISQSGANAIERIKALEKAEATPNDAEYPRGDGLGHQLSTIARVIKANVGLEVAQADYGGWDHHSAEGGAGGRHAEMLGHLTQCLLAFHKDLGPRMDRVLVLVMSEFGRTIQDNGASGTDHGRGGFMLAMGNMIKPQKGTPIHGDWRGINDGEGGRFLPVHTDVRLVFGEALNRLYNIDPIKSGIFPQLTSKTGLLEFLKPLPEV